jgi:hypothetical protein
MKPNGSGNGVYVLLRLNRSFTDLQGHWSQKAVELLASKLIVNGESDVLFAPERDVTRAEFAALLVRALGLKPENGSGEFKDMTASDRYAGVVGTAASIGIVRGFEDGTIRPDEPVTREQIAVMLDRTIEWLQMDKKNGLPAQDVLAAFGDNRFVSSWALEAMSGAVELGLIEGDDKGELSPGRQATRAEAAALVARLLEYLSFIE